MPLLFCNVGWMKHYDGSAGDRPARGGAYNKHSIGQEVCNFSDINGTVYGYVRATNETIRIENLGATKSAEAIDGVTVIWTAGPNDGGTVVVGWYEDATVFRSPQPFIRPTPLQLENQIVGYSITARFDQAVLLPEGQRVLPIPRRVKGGIGHSNVWYASKPESKGIVADVMALLDANRPNLPDVDRFQSATEGNRRLVAHLKRERNARLIRAKKALVRHATGKLCCEACGFDFARVYGAYGEDFCEVHHLKPLSEAEGFVETSLDDLSVVCSNCHRMIHNGNTMLTIQQLQDILSGQKNQFSAMA
jgi:5-methylcytosine-specific restriction protein A